MGLIQVIQLQLQLIQLKMIVVRMIWVILLQEVTTIYEYR
jgi:hypothetical protein